MKFEGFEKILEKSINEFKEKDKIGFIGLAGSKKIENDIDLVIFPSNLTKKGEFLKSLCNFLKLLRENIRKEKADFICVPHSTFQEEVEFISKKKKGDILLHISSFPDLMIQDRRLMKGLINSCVIYWGNKDLINKTSKTDMDYYYDYLFLTNCLYSNYPKSLETKKIRKKVEYVLKYNKGKIDFNGKTNIQIYFECCDFLDSISKVIL